MAQPDETKQSQQFEATRTKYSWNDPKSLISSVDIVESDFAGDRAVLHVNPNARPEDLKQLANLPVGFAAKRMDAFANERDNGKGGRENVLIVGAFKKDQDILNVLKNYNAVSGQPQQETPEEYTELKSQRGLGEKVQRYVNRYSMRLSGTFGLMGHGALASVGLIEKNNSYVRSAALYGAATAVQIAFNNGTGEIDFAPMVSDIKRYLKDEGLEVNDAKSKVLEDLEDDRPPVEKFMNLLETHPVEVSMFMMAPGHIEMISGNVARDGLQKGLTDLRSIQALTSLVGVMMSVFIEENRHEDIAERKQWEKENVNGLGAQLAYLPSRLLNFIKDRPVGANGVLNLTDNVTGVMNAMALADTHKQWEGDPAKAAEITKDFNAKAAADPKFASSKAGEKMQQSIDNWMGNAHKIGKLDAEYNSLVAGDIAHGSPEAKAAALKTGGKLQWQRADLDRQLNLTKNANLDMVRKLTWFQSFAWGAASSMTALTSRNRDPELETEAVYDKMYALAAAELVQQPKDMQQALVAQTAAMLSANPEVHISPKDIEHKIMNKMDAISKNPFLDYAHKQNTVQVEVPSAQHAHAQQHVVAENVMPQQPQMLQQQTPQPQDQRDSAIIKLEQEILRRQQGGNVQPTPDSILAQGRRISNGNVELQPTPELLNA